MAERLGKMIECDRCGKSRFLNYTGTDTRDGGFTKYTLFDKIPDGGKNHSDTGLLCDECEKEYQALLNEFLDKQGITCPKFGSAPKSN